MKKIIIKTIPYGAMRYKSAGDYWNTSKSVEFRIANFKNWEYEMLIALHELVEYILVTKREIDIKDIDNFDMAFTGEGEAGDDINAPYFEQHQFATKIERLMADQLLVNFDKYNNEILEKHAS